MSEREEPYLEEWLVRRVAAQAGPCPQESLLIEYADAQLSFESATQIGKHVEMCGECQAFLQREGMIAEAAREVVEIPEGELPTVPETLRERVFSAAMRPVEKQGTVGFFSRRFSVPVWGMLAPAAGLLLVLCAAWLVMIDHRRQGSAADDLSAPTSNIQVLTLVGAVRSEGQLPEVSRSSRLVVLQLPTLADLKGPIHWRAELRDGSERICWAVDDLKPAREFAGFALAIPGRLLAPGRSAVILVASKDGQELWRREYGVLVVR